MNKFVHSDALVRGYSKIQVLNNLTDLEEFNVNIEALNRDMEVLRDTYSTVLREKATEIEEAYYNLFAPDNIGYLAAKSEFPESGKKTKNLQRSR